MMAPMPDITVVYDPQRKCGRLVFNGRDWALDATPESALLISLGSDRRAHADDKLPDAYSLTNPAQPGTLMARRGWVGDALDPLGRLIGSRWWIFQRQKAIEPVRKGIEDATAEAVGWLATGRGIAINIAVRWLRHGVLAVRVRAGNSTVALNMAVSG